MGCMNSKMARDPLSRARAHWLAHGWHEAEPGMAAVTAVVQTGQTLRLQVEEVLEPFGLTFPRYEVLSLLRFASSPAIPMAKVASRLQIQPASLTHTARRLQDDGHVLRSANPADARGSLLSITDQGLALVNAATPALNRYFEHIGISSAEAETLIGILSKLKGQ